MPPPRASEASASGSSGTPWPFAIVTRSELPRCVTGISAAAGHGRDARDARGDGERDPRLGELERLLAAAAEDERVAALEADDLEPGPPVLDEQRVDLRLLERRARDHERVLGRLRDELRRDERVVDEHVAGANELQPAGRDQPGVARAGADEVDGHESARSTRRSKYALRSS